MNEIPTPETDVMATMQRTIEEWIRHSESLERRLAVARGGLKMVRDDSSSTRIVRIAEEALTAITPK